LPSASKVPMGGEGMVWRSDTVRIFQRMGSVDAREGGSAGGRKTDATSGVTTGDGQ
jgi:hypothetical protein